MNEDRFVLQKSSGERCNSSPITTGRDGYKNTCQLFKEDQNGPNQDENNVWISDLVLLAEDTVVRNRWPMGRVVDVYTGEDGGVRPARVKTAGGVFHSPVTRICLLEDANDDE